jgi:hypothetical protein
MLFVVASTTLTYTIYCKNLFRTVVFKLHYNGALRSSGILHSVEWYFCTDVSGQPIVPIFKGQEVQEEA